MKISLIDIGALSDDRGEINFLDVQNQIPFQIRNVFFIKDVPAGKSRGAHANKKSHEFVIAISGSFDININKKESFNLCSSDKGLLIPANTWLEIVNFSEDAICLVLSSELYDVNEKILDA